MNRLKECREKSGLSQKTVAASLKVAAPSVSNWESGKTNPTHENLEKLADLYGVSVDHLLGRDVPASSEKEQKEKPIEADGLSENERAILDLLRQVPDEALPATHRAIMAMLDALKDKQ